MVSIATAALTVAILIFGEITPKNYATLNAEKITLRYIPVLSFFMTDHDSVHLHHQSVFKNLYEASACGS